MANSDMDIILPGTALDDLQSDNAVKALQTIFQRVLRDYIGDCSYFFDHIELKSLNEKPTDARMIADIHVLPFADELKVFYNQGKLGLYIEVADGSTDWFENAKRLLLEISKQYADRLSPVMYSHDEGLYLPTQGNADWQVKPSSLIFGYRFKLEHCFAPVKLFQKWEFIHILRTKQRELDVFIDEQQRNKLTQKIAESCTT